MRARGHGSSDGDAQGAAINLEEYENGIRCTNICPGEVATEILDKRKTHFPWKTRRARISLMCGMMRAGPVPPPPERRKLMLQPEDLGAAAVMVACLPPRAHVTEIVMTGKTTVAQAVH